LFPNLNTTFSFFLSELYALCISQAIKHPHHERHLYPATTTVSGSLTSQSTTSVIIIIILSGSKPLEIH
jgi:hypothetical protein